MTTSTTEDLTQVKYRVWDLVDGGEFEEAREAVVSSSMEGLDRTELLNYIRRRRRNKRLADSMVEDDKSSPFENLDKQLRDQRVVSDTRTARSQQKPIVGRSDAVKERHDTDNCECPDCKQRMVEVEASNDAEFDQGDRYGDPDPDHKLSGSPTTTSSTDQADQQRPIEHKIPRFFYKAEVQIEIKDPKSGEDVWVDPVEFAKSIDLDELSEEQKVALYREVDSAYKRISAELHKVTGGAIGAAPELNAANTSMEGLLVRLMGAMKTPVSQIEADDKNADALEEHIEESFQASPPPIELEKQEDKKKTGRSTTRDVKISDDDHNWLVTARKRRAEAKKRAEEKSSAQKTFRTI